MSRPAALDTRVVHSLEATQRLTDPDPTPEQVAQWRRVPDKVHPLVWTHHSGRRSLVIGATASHVEGKDVDEGRAFLAAARRGRPRPIGCTGTSGRSATS